MATVNFSKLREKRIHLRDVKFVRDQYLQSMTDRVDDTVQSIFKRTQQYIADKKVDLRLACVMMDDRRQVGIVPTVNMLENVLSYLLLYITGLVQDNTTVVIDMRLDGSFFYVHIRECKLTISMQKAFHFIKSNASTPVSALQRWLGAHHGHMRYTQALDQSYHFYFQIRIK